MRSVYLWLGLLSFMVSFNPVFGVPKNQPPTEESQSSVNPVKNNLSTNSLNSPTQTIMLTRPNQERLFVSTQPGCYGISGPVSKAEVPEGKLIVLYSEYACKGSLLNDKGVGVHELTSAGSPSLAKSIEVFDLEQLTC